MVQTLQGTRMGTVWMMEQCRGRVMGSSGVWWGTVVAEAGLLSATTLMAPQGWCGLWCSWRSWGQMILVKLSTAPRTYVDREGMAKELHKCYIHIQGYTRARTQSL